MDEKEFLAQLGETNAAPVSVAPLTEAALQKTQASVSASQMGKPQTVSPSKWADPDFATKLGARPGVPFDINSGVPWLSRLRMAVQPTQEEEVKALKGAYGDENVRLNPLGWPVVTLKDEQGKPKDVLANPMGIEWGDAATLVGNLPEIAGSVLMAIASRGGSVTPGILSAIKTLAKTAGLAAVGAEGAGAIKDVGVRAAEGESIRPGEVAERRTGMAALDFGIGGGMGFFGKAVGTLISPMSKVGPLQFNAREAQKYIQGKYNIALPLTPAEATGNPFLQRSEAMWMAKPGSSTSFDAFVAERNKQITELQKLAIGGAVPDEEEAMKKALAALGGKVSPLEFGVERAAAATSQAATTEIKAGVGTAVDKTALGQQIRGRAEVLRKEFQDRTSKLYDDVFSDPLTQVKNIPGDDLAKKATDLIDKLPSVQNQVTQATGLVNQQGQSITRTVTQSETLKEFVPSNVLPKLRQLAEGNGQKFRLDELMAMRREVDNDIAMGESIPGVQTRYLSQIRGMLTDKIKDGLGKLSPDLLKKWETANNEYAAGVTKFKKAGIAEIFRDPEQLNYLGDTSLVSRVTEGKGAQDTYRAYKEFFGAGSTEVKGVQQAIRDDVLGLSDLSETIDAKGFVRRLEALSKDAPEALTDAFGTDAKALRKSALALQAAEGGTLAKEELVAAANSGNLSGEKLVQMISAQETRDRAYQNELVKMIGDGTLKVEKIKPTQVVEKLVFRKGTQPEDLEKLTSLIADRPDVLEDLRRLTFKRVLDDATIKAPSGERLLGAKELEQALAEDNQLKRLRAIIGTGGVEDLRQLAAFLQPGAIQQQSAKSAGGIAAGQQIAGIMDRGELKYISRAIKNFVLAEVYTSPLLRRYFANTALSAEGSANIVNLAIASTPFVESLAKTFTREGARMAMAGIKGSIDRYVQENPNAAQQGPTKGTSDIPWDDFLQRLEKP